MTPEATKWFRSLTPPQKTAALGVALQMGGGLVLGVLEELSTEKGEENVNRFREVYNRLIGLAHSEPMSVGRAKLDREQRFLVDLEMNPKAFVDETITSGRLVVSVPEWKPRFPPFQPKREEIIAAVQDLASALEQLRHVLVQPTPGREHANEISEGIRTALRAWRQINPNCKKEGNDCFKRFHETLQRVTTEILQDTAFRDAVKAIRERGKTPSINLVIEVAEEGPGWAYSLQASIDGQRAQADDHEKQGGSLSERVLAAFEAAVSRINTPSEIFVHLPSLPVSVDMEVTNAMVEMARENDNLVDVIFLPRMAPAAVQATRRVLQGKL